MLTSENSHITSQALFENILQKLCDITKNPILAPSQKLMKEVGFVLYNIIGDNDYSVQRVMDEVTPIEVLTNDLCRRSDPNI